MDSMDDLQQDLYRIDGKGYRAYKDIQGRRYLEPGDAGFVLHVDYVQGDPFAGPSRMRVRVETGVAGFPEWVSSSKSRRVGLETYLAKEFAAACQTVSTRAGSGKSGKFGNDRPGQEVVERTAVMVTEDAVEARFFVGLPAQGRRVLGRAAAAMLGEDLPRIVAESLLYRALNGDQIREAVEVNEDADALRAGLAEQKLVAIVGDGAVLPRRSGIDQRPMSGEEVRAFESPESLRVTISVPNRGKVSGLGIPEGVNLIVGGGFHGKSTLLNALERGVYNHCPGDGREFVVTRQDAVKIRAEDGRSVTGVDISPFIGTLPGGKGTENFSTENASGSTSQAANVVEAIESGADALLIDEDIAATNFMIRDRRMQELVARDKEPITPFIDRVRPLRDEHGVSAVLVIGGSGDYFDVADTVIMMEEYVPRDVTAEAKAIAAERETGREEEIRALELGKRGGRIPLPRSIDPARGRKEVNVKTRAVDVISFGEETIDLGAVSQLVTESQTRGIASALVWARGRGIIDGKRSVGEILDAVEEQIAREGFDGIAGGRPGGIAAFRRHELAAAVNRLRSLRMVEGRG
ncbi:MAG: ABC-ATPase domain-containing protein [Verrucomicrobiota bacterium]